MVNYTTPTSDILRTPESPRADKTPSGESLARLLSYLGIGCDFVSLSVSAQLVKYNFNLHDISKIGKIKKSLSALSALLHIVEPITLSTSVDAHFSLILPRESPSIVPLKSVINTKTFNNSSIITAALGLSTNNEVLKIDFLESPHVLVAGMTGSGKSVCIDTILSSLLFKASPLDLGLILIDPKQVSFVNYQHLPHLLKPIVTSSYEALQVLKMACTLMDNRYRTFKNEGVKDIKQTNTRHILIVIDELADLMLSDERKEIDKLIQRIAQLGRAAGVHLLLATQQPIVKILTTTIKANIITKIALKTSSMRDSMNILDYKGAEELRGKGDGLARLPEFANDVRFQTAYINDEEIQKICSFWSNQKPLAIN